MLITFSNRKKKEPKSESNSNKFERKISSRDEGNNSKLGVIGLSYKENRLIAEPILTNVDTEIDGSFMFMTWIQAWTTKMPHLEFKFRKRSSESKQWRYYYFDTKRKITVGFSKDEVLDELNKIKRGTSTILSEGSKVEPEIKPNPFIPVNGIKRKHK